MAALVKEQMSEAMQMDMKVKILPLPKFSPQYNSDEPAPHTEIVVYEASDAMQLQKSITISECVHCLTFFNFVLLRIEMSQNVKSYNSV